VVGLPYMRAGQLLYRGCSCDEFARILRVGKDAGAVSTGGCYRCTELFYPHDEGTNPFKK
jgi:hypothetical protein